jgi:Peptidase_C39 like family
VVLPTSRRLLASALLPLALVAAVSVAPAQAAGAARHISYTQWAGFRGGTPEGVRVANGKLLISRPIKTTRYGAPKRSYDVGRWTSPWRMSKYGLTELVPSWVAATPSHTWIQVQVRGANMAGARSSWDTIARWASGDGTIRRTSLGAQNDDLARVATDTWEAKSVLKSWQLRVSLFRRTGTTRTPRVDTLGAMTSDLPAVSSVPTSTPGVARGVVLKVPRYSQMTHAGQYPRYGGGGEAWCSPTSTTMVLAYYDSLPRPATYQWVKRSYTDRVVDQSARMTYDYAYAGTGNWPFNTAYAATHTGHAFVTRLHSLREAERFIKAGIPLVASITFGRGGLDGAPISATKGHLVVVVGFTKTGDVVVNDPAAPRNGTVRRTYDRGQFEDAWLKRSPSSGGSGGLVYVIRDAAHPLPALTGNTNW